MSQATSAGLLAPMGFGGHQHRGGGCSWAARWLVLRVLIDLADPPTGDIDEGEHTTSRYRCADEHSDALEQVTLVRGMRPIWAEVGQGGEVLLTVHPGRTPNWQRPQAQEYGCFVQDMVTDAQLPTHCAQ